MKFTNKQILYFNVFLLFVLAFILTTLLFDGFKTNHFKFFRIMFNGIAIYFTIKNIKRYNI